MRRTLAIRPDRARGCVPRRHTRATRSSRVEVERNPCRGYEFVVLGARRRRVVVLVDERDLEGEPFEHRHVERRLGAREIVALPVVDRRAGTPRGRATACRTPGPRRPARRTRSLQKSLLPRRRSIRPRIVSSAEVVLVDPREADVGGEVRSLALDEVVASAAARLGAQREVQRLSCVKRDDAYVYQCSVRSSSPRPNANSVFSVIVRSSSCVVLIRVARARLEQEPRRTSSCARSRTRRSRASCRWCCRCRPRPRRTTPSRSACGCASARRTSRSSCSRRRRESSVPTSMRVAVAGASPTSTNLPSSTPRIRPRASPSSPCNTV